MKTIKCNDYEVSTETASRWVASQIFAQATMDSQSGTWCVYSSEFKDFGFDAEEDFVSIMQQVVDCLRSDFSIQVAEANLEEDDGEKYIDITLYTDYCVGLI